MNQLILKFEIETQLSRSRCFDL